MTAPEPTPTYYRPAPEPRVDTQASGTCQTVGCSEYQVEKDYHLLPPGYRPVLCGICNVEIEITEVPVGE